MTLAIDPQPTTPTIPVPQVPSVPASGSIGPIRTARKTRAPTHVTKHVPANAANPENSNTLQVEVPEVQLPDVNAPQLHTPQVGLPQATTLPSDMPQANATPAEPDAPITTATPSEPDGFVAMISPTEFVEPVSTTTPTGVTSLPAAEVPDDDVPDNMSFTSTLPDIFDVGMDDSAPPATGPWTIIDHFTGEMIVDDDQSSPSPVGVEVAITPRLGTTYLVENPPTLLSEDEDVRPRWLMTAVNTFLRFVPCVGSLGKVVDLYLAQEARLGYPQLVCISVLVLYNSRSDDVSLLASHFRLATGPPRLRRS